MKRTLIAFAFAIFCSVMPLLMAKATAQESGSMETLTSTTEQTVESPSGLDSRQKAQIRSVIRDIVDDQGIHFGGANIGFPEMILGLTAICLSLGLPVLILLVVFIFAQKKRRQMMELAGMYIKADQPMPEHVMAEFGSNMTADKRLRSGIQLLLVGIAVTAILGAHADEAATFGLIPIAVGLARIIYWRYESKQTKQEQAGLPEVVE